MKVEFIVPSKGLLLKSVMKQFYFFIWNSAAVLHEHYITLCSVDNMKV